MTEGTTTVAPAVGTLAADPAFAQFDAETQGMFKNKGWDTKTPAEAAREAAKSYHEAEKFLGVPKDQLVRMPKDAADAAGWKAFHERIGVPPDAKGYDFTAVKFADGTALDANFIEAVAPALQLAGVSKDRAPEVIKAVVKFMDGAESTENAETTAKLAVERDLWKKECAGNLDANQFIIKQAVQTLGLTEEIVGGLEKQAGYFPIMKALLKIGQMMGEDKFIASPASGEKGIMTVGQAQARLSELKADTAWVTRFNNGDNKANLEFNHLTTLTANAGG